MDISKIFSIFILCNKNDKRYDKIKVNIEGIVFRLPATQLVRQDHRKNPVNPYIYLRPKDVASLMKQYVTTKYPQVTVTVSSDIYSGGDSVRVYLSDKVGNPVDDVIRKDVDRFSLKFEQGRFDGMSDMYEYRDEAILSDNGTKISGGTKYIFVENRPQFGTLPDVVKMLVDYQAGGKRDLQGSIREVMRYGIPQKMIDKALQLL